MECTLGLVYMSVRQYKLVGEYMLAVALAVRQSPRLPGELELVESRVRQ